MTDLPAQPQGAPTIHTVEFRGRGGEYFRIWIVNIALSVLTLGIYTAWAKVRTQRYFYGNTYLAGESFVYHASAWRSIRAGSRSYSAPGTRQPPHSAWPVTTTG